MKLSFVLYTQTPLLLGSKNDSLSLSGGYINNEGFPYISDKTIKGRIRESFLLKIKEVRPNYRLLKEIESEIFGSANSLGTVYFSNAYLLDSRKENVEDYTFISNSVLND
ncbi:MAG: CRISPR/Cas system CMR subunit Cmr6 (Cas7 group RAMP superfamily) [Arcticibacterium sp.]|jgi:CRISPR/Cas system CMR subunit Cmr6 (Cas7 group RAMP superfamily)